MKRTWIVESQFDHTTGDRQFDHGQVAELATFLAGVVAELGGVYTVIADRAEQPGGVWETQRVILAYDSYAPGRRQRPHRDAERPSEANGQVETTVEDSEVSEALTEAPEPVEG